jgi:hypothetical protein
MQRLQRVHAVGMDPDEVGRKISNGVVRGDFYIFPHSEFRDEVRDLCDEIVASMSTAEAPDPKRVDFEHMRRRAKAEATQAIDRLRESARSREAVPGRQESAAELERTRNICREVDRQMACGERRYHELHHLAQAARIELAAEQWGRPGEREARAKVQARLVSAELEQQAILRELALIETETSAWVPPRESHV